ncbi:MFS transporter [Actinomadura decatromicini]|uniref:MFS transporter n=1 Tax=Actinomadura decatromicini TaxID=2604572 RepID=A0A5D3F5H0_9ACTN|nr:MFS transporter [Actinomadura decatromicini]TYK42930.1 MFS transporter [Actinomadura decatromicini]
MHLRHSGETTPRTPRKSREHRAIGVIFIAHGAVAGTLATRIPWIQDRLDLSPTVLGLALLCPSIGAFTGMPTASRVAHRIGERRAVRLLIAAWCAIIALPALAPAPGWLFAAMLLYGGAAGMSDVVMNSHAVAVERAIGRPVMSGLHGLWCVGSLAAGGVGILAAHHGVDARLHLGLVAAVLLGVGVAGGRGLLPDRPAAGVPAPRRFALPNRAVLAIGLVGFCGTFAEGASADWTAVYLTEVTDAGPGLAAASFTIFMTCMAATRLAGDRLVRRFGAPKVVRCGGGVAVLGGVLVVAARAPWTAITGFALIGVGVATVVPLVFAAAADRGATPGEGVAGVATITYLSGLTAPAVTGWTAGTLSYPAAFAMITCIVAVMTVSAGALRPRPSGEAGAPGARPVPSESPALTTQDC